MFAAFVGPNWRRHYQRSFAAFRSGFFGPPVNVAALLVPQWLAFRGLWPLQLLAFAAYWVGVYYVGTHWALHSGEWLILVVPYLVLAAIEGLAADRLVYWRACRALARVRARGLEPAEALAAMRRAGGVSIVAPVLIPVLACGVLYYFTVHLGHRHGHERAYTAAMRSDLRNLVTAEESYFADNVTYTTSLTNMLFTPSTGVTITIGAVSSIGWNATARHNATTRVCGIYIGAAATPVRGATEGEPKCVEGDQVPEHRH